MDRKALAGLASLMLASLIFGTLPAAADPDPACVQDINQKIARERQRVAIYSGQLKNLDSTLANRAASICKGALARAETYFKKTSDDDDDEADICDAGTTYTDSQIVQLFRSATSTCAKQFDDVVRTMGDEDQRAIRQNVNTALQQVK